MSSTSAYGRNDEEEDRRIHPLKAIAAASSYNRILGSSDIQSFLQDRTFFVDKTLFIKEFLICMDQVIGILYPRKFGKSLNLNMLDGFLSIDKQHLDFSGLKISDHVDVVQGHRGKYPVIKLDLKNCKGDTWEEMLESIWNSLRVMIEEHKEHLSEPIINMDSFDPEDDVDYKFALKFLTYDLYEKHKRKMMILIDDFDSPLHEAYKNGYYE
jgi:Predicted AAA-ATPase